MLEIKGIIVERVSNRTGNKYKVLEITFENGFKKSVFLNDSELFIIESINS